MVLALDTIQDTTVEDKELAAILQHVSTENGWGEVLSSSVVDSPSIKQDAGYIYTTFNFTCELEASQITEIALTTKGYLADDMYWIEEVIIE